MRQVSRFLVLSVLIFIGNAYQKGMPDMPEFSGNRALLLADEQLAFGPRFPGSEGHAEVQSWIAQELEQYGWHVTVQTFDYFGQTGKNILW